MAAPAPAASAPAPAPAGAPASEDGEFASEIAVFKSSRFMPFQMASADVHTALETLLALPE
eukprot:5153834-Prymnesium_polylepis.1